MQERDEGLMAMVCMHAILGQVAPAREGAHELLGGYSGHLLGSVYLILAGLSEDAGEQKEALAFYERAVWFNPHNRYGVYRLAWALRHPTRVDMTRAATLLEQLLDDIHRDPILNAPRLERALAHRAALELHALGRDIEVPPLDCPH